MANIRINPDQMDARAGEYRNEAAKIGEVISKMDSLLGQLQSEWEGDASRAYADKFNQLKPSFVNAQQLVEEIAASLAHTATQMREADSTLAGNFR